MGSPSPIRLDRSYQPSGLVDLGGGHGPPSNRSFTGSVVSSRADSPSRYDERSRTPRGVSGTASSVRSATTLSSMRGPVSGGVELHTKDWLKKLPDAVIQYAPQFERHGFGTAFAVGLMDEGDIAHIGIGPDHVDLLSRYLVGPRTLVARWTPLIASVPVSVTLTAWLRRLPVDLSVHATTLVEWGFDSVGVIRHITDEDVHDMELPIGHGRALVHCARSMADIEQQPSDITGRSLEEWLFCMQPSLDHYTKAIELAGVSSVLDLLYLTWADVSRIVMRRGHQRLLFHYIVAARAHWVDPL